ncbi:hypothetical protein LEP1GSC188_2342 [Leptospira weilii serovar Topaz str. LT2116]|uniref:Uncharacterized protein n=1 Tax=Leptospira weilii serovar Topaz str. LT2116 TaxID=1088540 RepID=M3EKS4_9LEPT|nr:hypothetical protein LEP1GSC188_2342 [Leptospira weilii serovar Topaz str. LT2116]
MKLISTRSRVFDNAPLSQTASARSASQRNDQNRVFNKQTKGNGERITDKNIMRIDQKIRKQTQIGTKFILAMRQK